MQQVTVKTLYLALAKLVKKGDGDKKIIVADDPEGNGYHGCFFTCTNDPHAIKEILENSNGLYDSEEENPKNLVIIG